MGWKFPEIPRPHSVVHLHYLEHFGASEYVDTWSMYDLFLIDSWSMYLKYALEVSHIYF